MFLLSKSVKNTVVEDTVIEDIVAAARGSGRLESSPPDRN